MTGKIQALTMKARGLRWLAGIALVGLCTLVGPASAQACRDCPFPTKIGDNQWLMPNSHLVLNIDEREISDEALLVKVRLSDQRTQELLAKGSAVRLKDQRTLTLTLRDMKGRKVRAQIHWVTFDEPVIQAKFDCDDEDDRCSIVDR